MSSRALIAATAVLTAALAGADTKGLLIPSGREADSSQPPRIGVMRSRAVDVDLSALAGVGGGLPAPGRPVILNLFDDVVLQARTLRAERTDHGMTWVGKLAGPSPGDAVIVVYDGVVEGSVSSADGAYTITWADGGQVVQQLDESAFPEDGSCFEEVAPAAPESPDTHEVALDDGSIVDVLVAYTPAARAAAGGTSQMQAKIQLAVTETNQGYANSNVVQRLRLVGTTETSYTEVATSISTDLNRVTSTSDGYMDEVPTLRDTYRADIVSLIGSGYAAGSGACGVAWLMSGNSPSFAPYAYSVVDVTCMTGYYSFGHEIGHNMGLNHARVDPVGPGAYFYSFGYKDPGNAFRTVMAYNCPVSCPRVLYFSNPTVFYGGKKTGINCTDPNCITPDSTSAYNALSLNNTRVTVANWRVGPSADVSVTKTDGVSAVTPGQPVTYTIQVSNAGPNPVTSATVTDSFPATLTSVSWTCSASAGSSCGSASGSGNINQAVNLAVGGTATFTATATLSLSATGTLSNTAAVSLPNNSDPNLANNSATDTDAVLALADLAISKTDGVSAVTPGQVVTYTIQVSNAGPNPVTNATVADTFPAALASVSWTCSASAGSSCSAASGSGNISRMVNLLVGGTATFTATGTLSLSAAGTLSNTAAVAVPAGYADSNTSNNSATDNDSILLLADVSVTKTDGTTTALPLQPISYTIVVSNSGPNPVSGVTVSDPAPAALLSPTWSCVAAGGATCTASGSGSISDTVNLPVGGTATYALTGTLAPNPPSLSNTATVALPVGYADPNIANNSATDSDSIQYPRTEFYTVTPCRVVDTRNPVGPTGGPTLAAVTTRSFPVTGSCNIPSTAAAVSVNVAAVGAAATGYLTLYRGDEASAPLVSTINFSAGQTRGNNAILPLAADGSIKLKNGSVGTVDFVLDVNGYFQ